jgi:hypothetical protein
MTSKALLLVMMEPPATLEEEFNDWYDTEHFPQRRSMPGFESASRWVCVDGWPRYVALYDLESPDALRSDAYLAVSGAQSTPWSKRVLARTCGRRRVIATALTADTSHRDDVPVSRLLVACYPRVRESHALVAQALDRLGTRNDVMDVRGFEERAEDATSLWLMVGFNAPISAAALHETLGALKGQGATVFNLYVPYTRG